MNISLSYARNPGFVFVAFILITLVDKNVYGTLATYEDKHTQS